MVGLKRTIVWAAAWVGLAVFLMFLAGRCLLGKTLPASKTVVPAEETLILDAGHGGEDGGAVSVTGARESDINLAVVLRLRDGAYQKKLAAVLLSVVQEEKSVRFP